jgi:hypothetical protein
MAPTKYLTIYTVVIYAVNWGEDLDMSGTGVIARHSRGTVQFG